MDQSRRHKYWLEANCLTLVCLLFSFTAFGQVAMRAPGAAVPGDVVVFGASPNLAVDGGAPTTGNGIATNNGAGNQNTLTNAVFTAPSNNITAFTAALIVTNDTAAGNFINDNRSMALEFTGVGDSNQPMLEWVGAAGNYGYVFMNTTHDGSPASTTKNELQLQSSHNVMIGPGNGTGTGHLQIGGAGVSTFDYLNVSSNLQAAGGVQLNNGSQPFMYLSKFQSNGVVFEWDPTIEAYASPSNNYQFNFDIAHDSGYFGSATAIPDVSKLVTLAAPVGIHMYGGTNGPNLFTGVKTYGRFGTITNVVNTLENNLGIGIGAPAWYFGSNSAPSSQPFFIYVQAQDAAWWGSQDPGLNFQISDDGTGGPTHGFYGGGGFGGFGIAKGGLSITAGINQVATNGNLLQVLGPSYLPTNAAPVGFTSNFTLVSQTPFTNLLNAGALADLDWTVTNSDQNASVGVVSFILVRIVNGTLINEGITNGLNGPGTNITTVLKTIVLGPGDVIYYTNQTFNTTAGAIGGQLSHLTVLP